MPVPASIKIHSGINSLGKQGQIDGYASSTEICCMPLKEISSLTNILMSTYSDIIRLSKTCHAENNNISQDPYTYKNLKPSPHCRISDNQILANTQKQVLITLVLNDTAHCHKSLAELIAKS